jgi:Trk K+ transport system NAD-binding subunit
VKFLKDVPIAANADLDDSVDILQLAGSTYVLQFMKLLGQSLSRRVLRTSTRSNVIGNIDALLIAEAPAMRTPLVGKSLQQSKLRETTGITVVGVWERGRFEIPTAATHIDSTTVLLLAGSADQLKNYDDHIGGIRNFMHRSLFWEAAGLALPLQRPGTGGYRLPNHRKK